MRGPTGRDRVEGERLQGPLAPVAHVEPEQAAVPVLARRGLLEDKDKVTTKVAKLLVYSILS